MSSDDGSDFEPDFDEENGRLSSKSSKHSKNDKDLKDQKEKVSKMKDKNSKGAKDKVIKDKVIKDDNADGRASKSSSKSTKGGAAKKGKKGKNKELRFDTFIHRVLKQVHPQVTITKHGMNVMNDLIVNAFTQISDEAGKLVKLDSRDTLHARDINASVRLVLPGELANHSNDEGEVALHRFEQNQKNKKNAAA